VGGGLSAHLTRLAVAQGRVGAALALGPAELAASAGGAWVSPRGLFALHDHLGVSLGLDARAAWSPPRLPRLALVGALAARGLLLPAGGVVAWSQLWGVSVGVRWALSGGAP